MHQYLAQHSTHRLSKGTANGRLAGAALQKRPCDHMMRVTPVGTARICSSQTNPGLVNGTCSDGGVEG